MTFGKASRRKAVNVEPLEGRLLFAKVAFFNDPAYVDLAGVEVDGSPASATNLYEELVGLKHQVATFTGTSSAAFKAALADADVLVVPDLVKARPTLTNETQDVIRNFVREGGGYITVGRTNSAEAMYGLFGYGIIGVFPGGFGGAQPTNQASRRDETAGTAFAAGPDHLTWTDNAPTSLYTPEVVDNGGVNAYMTDGYAGTVVGVFPYADRQPVVYLGNDWADAGPRGSWDGGWRETLGLAVGQATVGAVKAPEVAVLGNGVSIVNGDTAPSTADGTDLGTTPTGSPVSHTFTVANAGTGSLKIASLKAANGFTITDGLAATIAPGAEDTFTVQLNAAAAGTFTGNISFTTNDEDESTYTFAIAGVVTAPPPVGPVVPTAPSGVAVTGVEPFKVTVGWNDDATNEIGYRVEVSTSADGPWNTAGTTGAGATSFAVSGLLPSTAYFFRVRALGAGNGVSEVTAPASATTLAVVQQPQPLPPPAPSAVATGAVTASQFTLTWTDNALTETGYQVELATAANGPWAIAGTTGADANSFVCTGLSADTQYFARVRAVGTGALVSDYSATISARTDASVVGQPGNGRSFGVEFTKAPNGGSVLSGAVASVTLNVRSDQSGPAVVALYATTEATLIGSAVQLVVSPPINLVAGKVARVKLSFVYPALEGVVKLIAQATSAVSSGPIVGSGGVSDNVAVAPQPVTVAAANVTLAPISIALAKPLVQGKKASLTVVVQNSGNVAYAGSTGLSIVLTTDGVIGNEDDVQLTAITKKLKLKPNATKKLRISAIVGTSVSAGLSYRLAAVVAPAAITGVTVTGGSIVSEQAFAISAP